MATRDVGDTLQASNDLVEDAYDAQNLPRVGKKKERYRNSHLMCWQKSIKMTTSQFSNISSLFSAYYSAATLSGAFSGLIAYGVKIDLDGALAIGLGIIFWLFFPPFPDQIKTIKHWLFSSEEIALGKRKSTIFTASQIWRSFRDSKTYVFAIRNVGNTPAISSVGIFLPIFIQTFEFSPASSLFAPLATG
ncbi:hypothetical protein ACQKWADRAFT_324954 [Trichoderma austrokoningii]